MMHMNKHGNGITASRRADGTWFHRKKEWAKLNACALTGVAFGITSAYVAPQLAQQAGMDRMQAATWVASTSQYVIGTGAMFAASWVVNRKEFKGDAKGLLWHNLKLVGKSTMAGIVAMAAMAASAAAATYYGASEKISLTIALAANYAAYLTLFNLFNRRKHGGQGEAMERDGAPDASAGGRLHGY
ncbi:MAG: hypothetical protein WCY41_00225 [Candidatus Micrarchaeia archaeon]